MVSSVPPAEADDTLRELRDTLDAFENAHRTAEHAYECHRVFATELANIKRAYTEQIAGETGSDGKPKHSNAERREAELQRRLTEQWSDLLLDEEQAAQAKRVTQAEVERLAERLRTLRVITAHDTALIELTTEETRAAAMPQILRRRY